MDSSLISIIIPVYNVDKYLAFCLDSVCCQTYSNFEVFCIDDGSTDNSNYIIQQYMAKDSRIHLIQQKNSGVSSARNNGIHHATGKYICFIDADDAWHPDFLKIMTKAIDTNNDDMVCCGYTLFSKNTDICFPNFQRTKLRQYQHPLFRYLIHSMSMHHMVWGKIYKTDMVTKNLFDATIQHGEDSVFSYKIFTLAKRIGHISTQLYYYRESENSITRSGFSTKMIDDHIRVFLHLKIFFEQQDLSVITHYLVNRKLAKRCFRSLCHIPYKKDKRNYQTHWKNYHTILEKLIQEGTFQKRYLNFKYRILLYLWQHNYVSILRLFL